MPESGTHLVLVERLVSWVRLHYARERDGILFIDDPWRPSGEKPPRLSGYVPDVYWRTPDAQSALIGEAKPAYDVESRHSRAQYAVFLLHLKSLNDGTLCGRPRL